MAKKKHPQRTVHLISLGCPRNLVDSEVMVGLLAKEGYVPTPSRERADVIIVNTCGFLGAAREESLQTIRLAASSKKAGSKLIVAGCLTQVPDGTFDELRNEIHYVIGSGDVESIVAAVRSEQAGISLSSAKSYLEQGDVPRALSTPPHYTYCKIAEGCRKGCSYCIIPHIKGPLKSKTEEAVVREVTALIQGGAFEIILIAQDLGDFGKDRGATGSSGLTHLLQSLLKLPLDFRLRLLYLYPDEIDQPLIDVMKSDPRILPYLDMPIQHINDTILKAMRRATSKEQILRTINSLRTELPTITIRTSLIVGFPGETEEQFEELCRFVRAQELDSVGIFSYSKEALSLSATLPGHIPDEIKQQRASRLGDIQKAIVTKRHQQCIGQRMPVIIDGYHPETNLLMIGRRPGQCPEIDPVVLINDARKVRAFGKTYLVEITALSDYDLVGRVIKSINRKEWT